jgi:hypothetical protein
MSPPYLGLKSKAGKKDEVRSKQSYCLIHVALLLSLLFNPDHGNGMFFRNVGWLSEGYSMLYSTRYTNMNAAVF